MYGLINKSLKLMVTEAYGQDIWSTIVSKADLPSDDFVSMKSYDDDDTYALVGAASEVLGAPAEACLEMFGVYWATKVAPVSFKAIFDSTGGSVVEFLSNLNHLHDRITTIFPGYIPPYFEVEEENDNTIVIYESEREGLTPFVTGLLKGLAEHFNETVDVLSITPLPNGEGDKSKFVINLS